MDEYDVFRIIIHSKMKKESKNVYLFSGLTLDELNFIQHEINYFCISGGFEREPWEKAMARRVVNNINDLKNTKLQRDLKFKKLKIT